MANENLQIGRVVLSKAGRDQGKFFVIMDVLDDQYVLIVNGQQHRLENPKKKKLKHLNIMPDMIQNVVNKKNAGIKMFDSEIRNNLESLGYTTKGRNKEE